MKKYLIIIILCIILGAGISILLKSIGIENANSISSGITGGIVGALYPLWNKIKK